MLLISQLVGDHITALGNIQNIFDQIHGNQQRQVVFKKFGQFEPLKVGLENAPDVLLILDQFIIPWKQTNIETVTEYLESEKHLDDTEKSKYLIRLLKELAIVVFSSVETKSSVDVTVE